jgi:2,3-bisphosphoglycerate-dependent phosphoglycerate mutase|tara:strand:- start:872 stop:1495 length:624 start_codon:yes stop_codon:yes gene_type:complete
MKNILLIRHGQSEWNKLNLFTGFKNVDLTQQGVEEAIKASENFKELGIKFDLVYTSVLSRAQKTSEIILKELGQHEDLKKNSKIIEHIALNERDYGDLTGLDKKETADKYGDEQVHKWRRGYSDRPPGGESLEDVVTRVKSYYDSEILPQIVSELNNNILIAAHGNSLRALLLVMNVYKIEEINSVELSTGVPIHITYQDSQFLIKK